MTSCGVMWVTPARAAPRGAAGGEQGRRQAQRVGGHDVVVGEAVDQEQRPGQLTGQGEQRAGVVGVGLLGGIAEVALGVVGVVEPPLGHRCAGDGGVEDVGPPEHGEGGEVAAEAPPPDRHAVEVEDAVLLGGRLSASTWSSSTAVARSRWTARSQSDPAARRPPAVGDDDGEPLVGEPLRADVGVVGAHDPPGVRPP